jgi:signal transduction histidine kinase
VGIGLGLPIARRLVEAQGGRIELETPGSGRGTAVALMLPVAGADAMDSHAREVEETGLETGIRS